MNNDNKCYASSWDDICNVALSHYDDVSTRGQHWCSTVVHAIEFYRKHGNPNTVELPPSPNTQRNATPKRFRWFTFGYFVGGIIGIVAMYGAIYWW